MVPGGHGSQSLSAVICAKVGYHPGSNYAIVVNPSHDVTGQVRLRLSFITDVTGTIALNGPDVVPTLTQPGSQAMYTFNGTVGQQVGLDITGSTFPDGCGVFAIVNPENLVLRVGCTGNGSGHLDTFTLPTTGIYTVLINPPDRRVGTAHVRLHG
jgi:hypothetical protein